MSRVFVSTPMSTSWHAKPAPAPAEPSTLGFVQPKAAADQPMQRVRRAPRKLAKRESAAASRWRSTAKPLPQSASEVGGRFLYVTEPGGYLRRSGSRVMVYRGETLLLDVPAAKLQGVLIYGNAQVSTACLKSLLSEGVWVSLFSRHGQYRGRVQPPSERGGDLRRRQWERSIDPSFCLASAQAIVRGKVLGAIQTADRYAKNRAAESLGTARTTLRECIDKIGHAADLAALRGLEGTAARAYFDLVRRWNASDLPFDGREQRGTANPVNALLNLGYTLLTREVEGLSEAAGLDPAIGVYHLPAADRPSLACDLVEEFRHVVVDRLVLTLINKRMVTAAHFEEPDDKRGVRLTADGLRVFLAAYERWMRGGEDGGNGVRVQLIEQLGRWLEALAGRSPYLTHLEVVR